MAGPAPATKQCEPGALLGQVLGAVPSSEAAHHQAPYKHDSLPERPKGVDSSSTSASCMGSNPMAVISAACCGQFVKLWQRCACKHNLNIPPSGPHKLDPGRTRACNLWFRRPTPYPLGHRPLSGCSHKPFQYIPCSCSGTANETFSKWSHAGLSRGPYGY